MHASIRFLLFWFNHLSGRLIGLKWIFWSDSRFSPFSRLPERFLFSLPPPVGLYTFFRDLQNYKSQDQSSCTYIWVKLARKQKTSSISLITRFREKLNSTCFGDCDFLHPLAENIFFILETKLIFFIRKPRFEIRKSNRVNSQWKSK